MLLWKEVNSASYSSAILISFSSTFNFYFFPPSVRQSLFKEKLIWLFTLSFKREDRLDWFDRQDLHPLEAFSCSYRFLQLQLLIFALIFASSSIISVISRLPSECFEFWFMPLFLTQFALLVLLTPLISTEQKSNQNNTHEKIFHHHVAAATEIWLLCIVLPKPGGFLESNIEHWV